MNEDLAQLTRELVTTEGASRESLDALVATLQVDLPADYIDGRIRGKWRVRLSVIRGEVEPGPASRSTHPARRAGRALATTRACGDCE